MDSRFAHLYKRDSSVSMIRVKMSRRRSQSQKENREKMQNLRRHLDQLPELELSLDTSALEKSVVSSQEAARQAKVDKNKSAAEERRKMLARFKEKKALQKEKEKREKEKKGTFKVGLYHPQPLAYLPLNRAVSTAKKTAESMQSTRVTRSMKQTLQPKQPAEKQPALKKAEPITRANKSSVPAIARRRIAMVEPSLRAPITRSAAKSVMVQSVAKLAEDLRPHKTKADNRQPAAPPSGRGKTMPGHADSVADGKKETKVAEMITAVNPSSSIEEKMLVDAVTPVSFAPQGFVFEAPSGLRIFQPTPLSPHSTDAFLSPSLSAEPKMESKSQISPTFNSSAAPPLTVPTDLSACPPALLSDPLSADSPSSAPASLSHPPSAFPASLSPSSSSIALPPLAASSTSATSEPQHDVNYFRAIMVSETERMTGMSEFWELRFDDSTIPEEIRDQMRTAVGQARLLMNERFGQFSGLVDDCDFGRGEKITTCTDLQGFWDMVYFQVEDVDKKFNALKEAEARGWQQEIKPVTRQKKVVKKPPAIGVKPGAGAGASLAAKSRLAAVKAAMKAKQDAMKAAEVSDEAPGDAAPPSNVPDDTLPAQTMVFHGGFFQVESPVKAVGAVRRSSRLSAAPFTQCSSHGSKFSTAGRQKRSTVVGHSSPHPCITPSRNPPPIACPTSPPAVLTCTTEPPVCTRKQHTATLPCSPKPLHVSPEQYSSAPCVTPNGVSRTRLGQTDPKASHADLITPADDQINQSAEIKPHNSRYQTELPFHLPEHSSNRPELEGSAQESSMTALSQEQTEETEFTDVNTFHSDSLRHAMSFSDLPSECNKTPQAESVLSCVSVPPSPSMMSTTPQVQTSPAPSDKMGMRVSERSLNSTDCKMTENQGTGSIAGIDFERYLQPRARCSVSPVQSMAVESFSHGLDAEMESPQAQAEEPVHDALTTPTAFPRMAPLVVTPWTKEMNANPLLFTPEEREKVRQSVCERDLMMFTPPYDI